MSHARDIIEIDEGFAIAGASFAERARRSACRLAFSLNGI
jgi:hypothetical protein